MHPSSTSPLSRMFRPTSIAIVGISDRPLNLGRRVLASLLHRGFAGDIHLVNPRRPEVDGRPCHASLADIPTPVDLVLVMTPAEQCAAVVREAGEHGAGAAIVFAAGFSEVGGAGAERQTELANAARDTGIRVLGPNCQGLFFGPTGLSATFTPAVDRVTDTTTGLAYVGQSGAIGGCVLDVAGDMGLGIAAWVSTGNQVDLDLVDVALGLIEEPDVTVLMVYVESIRDGAAYATLAERAAELDKRLVVLRTGRSAAGKRATVSHTGSMLGGDVAFTLVSQRHGVLLVEDVDQLLAVAAIARSKPSIKDRRIGVITTSGGAGGLLADQCSDHDIELPLLGDRTQAELYSALPGFSAVANPVDLTAQIFYSEGFTNAMGSACAAVAADPDVDAVAVVLSMLTSEAAVHIAQDLVDTDKATDKALLVAWLSGESGTSAARQIFRGAGMPVFRSVGDLARAANALMPRASSNHPDPAGTLEESHGGVGQAVLLESNATGLELLERLGVRQPASTLAADRASATQAAEAMDSPTVVLKIHAPSVPHKSELGGVRLGVPVGEVGTNFDELVAAAAGHGVLDLEGILVQEEIPSGVELIVGITREPGGFPPVLTVGIGGVTTELYRDVVSDLAPVSPARAASLLQQLRGWPLLSGFRGRRPSDVQAAAFAIAAVSRLANRDDDHFFEFEINPLIVAGSGQGVFAVDVLVRETETHLSADLRSPGQEGTAHGPGLPG